MRKLAFLKLNSIKRNLLPLLMYVCMYAFYIVIGEPREPKGGPRQGPTEGFFQGPREGPLQGPRDRPGDTPKGIHICIAKVYISVALGAITAVPFCRLLLAGP